MRADTQLPIAVLICLLPLLSFAQSTLTEGTNLSADVSPVDGRITFDLLGGIWIVDGRGGAAIAQPNTVLPAKLPRWSPSGRFLVYQASNSSGNQLWMHRLSDNESTRLSVAGHSDQHASWHPDGERVVLSSVGNNGGLDLWEIDIATGLRWRISSADGDESEPAWSANGRHLTWVSQDKNGWALMLRRRGQPDTMLHQSEKEIRAPSWRPDGSLITFLANTDTGYEMYMAILSDPPLIRRYSDDEKDPFFSRVSWGDRHQMIYAADGMILSRQFDDRRAKTVRFRATISKTASRSTTPPARRPLPIVTPASDKLVIRAARLFDGQRSDYRENVDVVIDGARISSVEKRGNHGEAVVLDLGNVTILPGFIDIYSALPKGDKITSGVSMLAYGVTTIVSSDPTGNFDTIDWHSEESPGPRLIRAGSITDPIDGDRLFLATLPANMALEDGPRSLVRDWQDLGVPVLAENWTVGLGLGVDLLLGADTLPSSPGGIQYQDMKTVVGGGPVTLVSGLADSGTPGLSQLLNSRQAMRFGHNNAMVRRVALTPRLENTNSTLVLGSKPSGLPPGLAFHAELRALAAAGLRGDQLLKAAGANAANTLGLGEQIGIIAPGALADMVLVAGDPLENVADALKIVAVVRNGRFYSLVSLLEKAESPQDVE